jgi:hypothetical protein
MNETEFYESIERWTDADISTWTHITLLAHFCKKYESKNGVKFRLVRARRGPTMGKEAADFAKLFRTLAPENYKELPKAKKDVVRHQVNLKIYNYINWMFDYKFRRGQQSVNGTRIFLVASIVNEFERMYEGYLNKKNVASKIEELISWCREEADEIFVSHQLSREDDIKMIKRYAEMYDLGQDSVEMRVLAKANEVGLL